MTEDDNSSLALENSSFEPKNWERVQGGDDEDSKNSTGDNTNDSELSEEAFSKSTSVTDTPVGLASGGTTLNIGGNDTNEDAIENKRKTLALSDSTTTDSDATDEKSGKDAKKRATKKLVVEWGTKVLNERGSSGNTTDIMDILSDPDKKKWPSEPERVEGESPNQPVNMSMILCKRGIDK